MTPELERAYKNMAMVVCDIIETSECNDGDCFEVHEDLHQELAAAYRDVFQEQQKETPSSSQEDPTEYMIYTKLHDMPFAFIGKHRRDLETNNWHYYEKVDGELIHFRKEHMIAVVGGSKI